MIELAVGIANHGWEVVESSLKGLSGGLEEQLQKLLKTGLKLVAREGRSLLRFLAFFHSGRFMREEMGAVAGGARRHRVANGNELEPDAEEFADHRTKRMVDRGLEQLEKAGLIEFDQDFGIYTFHRALLYQLGRRPEMDRDRALLSLLTLFVFYMRYLRAHSDNDAAIDVRDNALEAYC